MATASRYTQAPCLRGTGRRRTALKTIVPDKRIDLRVPAGQGLHVHPRTLLQQGEGAFSLFLNPSDRTSYRLPEPSEIQNKRSPIFKSERYAVFSIRHHRVCGHSTRIDTERPRGNVRFSRVLCMHKKKCRRGIATSIPCPSESIEQVSNAYPGLPLPCRRDGPR